MKINAPEKIYLPYKDDRLIGLVKTEGVKFNSGVDGHIEYTRTDAFVEKAAQWLKENLLNHTYVYEGEVGIGMAVFLEDFKKAMKL